MIGYREVWLVSWSYDRVSWSYDYWNGETSMNSALECAGNHFLNIYWWFGWSDRMAPCVKFTWNYMRLFCFYMDHGILRIFDRRWRDPVSCWHWVHQAGGIDGVTLAFFPLSGHWLASSINSEAFVMRIIEHDTHQKHSWKMSLIQCIQVSVIPGPSVRYPFWSP